jgi:SAM-dependent methyltransferase
VPDGLPVPPENLRLWVGPFADAALFRESGERMVQTVVDLCGLTPDGHVLEVGCGCGRLALALAKRLGPTGRYEGFDVAQPLLDWCRAQLEPVLPGFRFRLVDVVALAHNPRGAVPAVHFRFPYENELFDVAIVVSVFTHMLSEGIENYVAEVARVLKPGGRCFATLFLFDPAAAAAVAGAMTIFDFRHRIGPCLAFDAARPEEGIAGDEGWMLGLLERSGLKIDEIVRGNWRAVRSYAISQDIIVAHKATSLSARNFESRHAQRPRNRSI